MELNIGNAFERLWLHHLHKAPIDKLPEEGQRIIGQLEARGVDIDPDGDGFVTPFDVRIFYHDKFESVRKEPGVQDLFNELEPIVDEASGRDATAKAMLFVFGPLIRAFEKLSQ